MARTHTRATLSHEALDQLGTAEATIHDALEPLVQEIAAYQNHWALRDASAIERLSEELHPRLGWLIIESDWQDNFLPCTGTVFSLKNSRNHRSTGSRKFVHKSVNL